MNKAVLDAELLDRIRTATKSFEITDENGNVLGSFVPNASFERIMMRALPHPTEKELAEARAEMREKGEKGGVSGEELLAGLDRIKREWEARQ